MKTVIGTNKTLYLYSELEQHYLNKNTTEIENNSLNVLQFYTNNLIKEDKEFFMFIIPDKSLICLDNIPDSYNKNNKYRFIDLIKNSNSITNFIDLYDKCNLNSSDYYITDTHANNIGSLKFVKEIMTNFINNENKINDIDNFLQFDEILNFKGDLTNPINLNNQQLCLDLHLHENITKITNIQFNGYINKIKDIDIEFRFCYSRPSKFVYNPNAIVKKTILIYGDSSTTNKLFELLSFYFENTFFYWNHYFINNKLIKFLNPDIIIDIRTERFLIMNNIIYNNIQKYDSNYDIKIKLLSYNKIYSILINLDMYELEQIINQVNNIYEIQNNLIKFSHILCHHTHLIKPYIDINKEIVLLFNKDLLMFYNDKIDVTISDLKLINFINFYKEKRKYKYDNLPDDFNWKTYTEINKDLRHMNEIESKMHFETNGYKENRKYKYEK